MLIRIVTVALLLATTSAAATFAASGSASGAALAATGSLVAAAIGYALGRKDRSMPAAIRTQMIKVADDLAQYPAFTRLLRAQGTRITESTCEAATVIATGLRDMDANVDRLRAMIDCSAHIEADELRPLVDAVGAPVIGMLGQLQFQDVTQQQIAFLARLSLIVDQHMINLARQLGNRRSMDRMTNFKDMFDKALDDCVMTSQREDHHTAVGLDLHEPSGPKIEMY